MTCFAAPEWLCECHYKGTWGRDWQGRSPTTCWKHRQGILLHSHLPGEKSAAYMLWNSNVNCWHLLLDTPLRGWPWQKSPHLHLFIHHVLVHFNLLILLSSLNICLSSSLSSSFCNTSGHWHYLIWYIILLLCILFIYFIYMLFYFIFTIFNFLDMTSDIQGRINF